MTWRLGLDALLKQLRRFISTDATLLVCGMYGQPRLGIITFALMNRRWPDAVKLVLPDIHHN